MKVESINPNYTNAMDEFKAKFSTQENSDTNKNSNHKSRKLKK